MNNIFLESPVKAKKVRNGVIAYQFSNGCININQKKYFSYSMTEAIRLFRQLKN